jgi:hypothetical protein
LVGGEAEEELPGSRRNWCCSASSGLFAAGTPNSSGAGGGERGVGLPDRSWEEREKTLRIRPDRGTGDRREEEGEGALRKDRLLLLLSFRVKEGEDEV